MKICSEKDCNEPYFAKGLCLLHYEKKRNNSPERKSKRKNSILFRLYGMTLKEYDEMVKKQDNRCAICYEHESAIINDVLKGLAVDHNHNTGGIRGLLCSNCNSVIGYAHDNIDLLNKCIQYLREHQ